MKYLRLIIISTIMLSTIGSCQKMDDVNQNAEYNSTYPVDSVKGYTIVQIESALKGARSWNAFRDRVKNINSSNSDDKEIDEFFANRYK